MNANLPLSRQPTSILVAFYKHLSYKIDKNGKVNDNAIHLLCLLQSRGYNVRKLIAETK